MSALCGRLFDIRGVAAAALRWSVNAVRPPGAAIERKQRLSPMAAGWRRSHPLPSA
jgi:hypothetical protein